MKNDVEYWNKDASIYDSRARRSQKAYGKIIENIIKISGKDMAVLDVGTGTGEVSLKLYDRVKQIVAIDSSPEMIKIAESKCRNKGIKNIDFQVHDLKTLPHDGQLFDLIIIINVLHVVSSSEDLIEEAKARLKTGGKIVIATYLHDENLISRLISFIMKRKGHPIVNKFNSSTFCSFIEKRSLKILEKEKIPNLMPVGYVVVSR